MGSNMIIIAPGIIIHFSSQAYQSRNFSLSSDFNKSNYKRDLNPLPAIFYYKLNTGVHQNVLKNL